MALPPGTTRGMKPVAPITGEHAAHLRVYLLLYDIWRTMRTTTSAFFLDLRYESAGSAIIYG